MLQVQATFAGGLAEHLQAAGGASASIAASLRESVSQMSSATDRLNTQVRHSFDLSLQAIKYSRIRYMMRHLRMLVA